MIQPDIKFLSPKLANKTNYRRLVMSQSQLLVRQKQPPFATVRLVNGCSNPGYWYLETSDSDEDGWNDTNTPYFFIAGIARPWCHAHD
jgi:hypothetical protein